MFLLLLPGIKSTHRQIRGKSITSNFERNKFVLWNSVRERTWQKYLICKTVSRIPVCAPTCLTVPSDNFITLHIFGRMQFELNINNILFHEMYTVAYIPNYKRMFMLYTVDHCRNTWIFVSFQQKYKSHLLANKSFLVKIFRRTNPKLIVPTIPTG